MRHQGVEATQRGRSRAEEAGAKEIVGLVSSRLGLGIETLPTAARSERLNIVAKSSPLGAPLPEKLEGMASRPLFRRKWHTSFRLEEAMSEVVQPHNLKAQSVWNSPGGSLRRDQPQHRRCHRARGRAAAAQAGERILDLATGTGWGVTRRRAALPRRQANRRRHRGPDARVRRARRRR